MINHPLMSFDRLCLELVRISGEGVGHEIELHLMDSAGTAIMTFRLPKVIARALTADEKECEIIMSPSGLVEVYNGEVLPQRLVSMGLDELIQQSLVPDMLEDEADIKAQLTALRHKLANALALADQAILSLPEQED